MFQKWSHVIQAPESAVQAFAGTIWAFTMAARTRAETITSTNATRQARCAGEVERRAPGVAQNACAPNCGAVRAGNDYFGKVGRSTGADPQVKSNEVDGSVVGKSRRGP